MYSTGAELWYFFVANARASFFGAFLLSVFVLTEFISIPFLTRYDTIFISALLFQVCALVCRFEHPREFAVIIIFHILATLMELFKTHTTIGSWTYPAVGSAVFAIGTVPLFSGFLYSAVGSYISRAFVFLHLRYEHMPHAIHLWILAILIYINFFTHHFIYDIRYVLFAYIVFMFYNTTVHFRVYQVVRRMPFLLTGFLTACFMWIAENVGTYTQIWLYPNQIELWQLVSFHKIGSWFLLLILSFALVSIVYRERVYGTTI